MKNSHAPFNYSRQPLSNPAPKPTFDAEAPTKPSRSLHLEPSPAPSDESVRLPFDMLQPFEVVNQQFRNQGVTFGNAIALIPSNPAYATPTGKTVLMGSPKNGCIEASFEKPVRFVAGLVTASRRTVMAAYDANNRRIEQVSTAAANLTTSHSGIAPNTELRVSASNIHRVTFQAFDGQLTLGELCFMH